MEADEETGDQELSQEIPRPERYVPRYFSRVFQARQDGDVAQIVEELGNMSKRTFCEDLVATTLGNFQDYVEDLFYYLPWLATRVNDQRVEILELKTRIEEITNVDQVDQLLKEKSNWSGALKQLEEDLQEAKQATERAVKERDEARSTSATNKTALEHYIQSVTMLGKEVNDLRIKVSTCNSKTQAAKAQVVQLQTQVTNLQKQLDDVTEERDEAVQDADNAQGKEEGLLARITELESKLASTKAPVDKGKRQQTE
ncbi:unnamed protein product [Calypogeia fissa]